MIFGFLIEIIDLIDEENILQDTKLNEIDFDKMLNLKKKGFADEEFADLVSSSTKEIEDFRKKLGVTPSFKRVDTCAAGCHRNCIHVFSI